MPLKTAGIIAEFNPFHEGHRLLLDKARKSGAETLLVVMSGNFVQRGEPALLPKAYRAEAALRLGADLVAELPLPWAMSGAETFSRGGVSLLSSLGAQELWFGSECGLAAPLWKIARLLETTAFSEVLRVPLNEGLSFAAAREKAVELLAGKELSSLLHEPNNTLGIEYCRAIIKQGSSMLPRSISRIGPGHHASSIEGTMASGSALRQEIRKKFKKDTLNANDNNSWRACLPHPSEEVVVKATKNGLCPSRISRMESAILSTLRRMKPEDFLHLPDISEGLENRLFQMAQKTSSLDELLFSVKAKRYSMARIRRILLSAYLGIHAEDAKGMPPYIRILGFTSRGEAYLKTIARHLPLPLLTTSTQLKRLDGRGAHVFNLESTATDLYALSLPTPPPCGEEYRHRLIKPSV